MRGAFALAIVLASIRGFGFLGCLYLALAVPKAGFAVVDLADWAVYLALYVWCAIGMVRRDAAAYAACSA
jgi:hypothetical protein